VIFHLEYNYDVIIREGNITIENMEHMWSLHTVCIQ